MHLKQSLLTECPPGHPEERRKHTRREAQGVIFLHILESDSRSTEIRASLLDLSASGFRASHTSTELCSGQEVAFYHDGEEGTAKVVWTRIVGQSVESGFVVCQGKRKD